MNTFGMLLKKHRKNAKLSQTKLAKEAGLSTSTISRLESGERGPLSKRTSIMALAKAMRLTQEETDILLSAAGFSPSTSLELALHPRDETMYRIAQELLELRNDPQISPAQIRFVEETLLLILRGARAALPTIDLAVVSSGAPTTRSLDEEERYLDDLLGDCIAGKFPSGKMPFMVLAAVARSPRWELKRRLAESLPALLKADVEWTLPLMETLRHDPPDKEWRTDIRRRVIESTPALWRVQPQAVGEMLRWRGGDEVYAALATLDVLNKIGDVALSEAIRPDILAHSAEKHRPAVALYAELLDRCTTDPDAALQAIETHRTDEKRLHRICLVRVLHRLLVSRPAETLKLMRHFLRREEGQPVEHQNIRRPIARHAAALIALLDGPYDDTALKLLYTLAADQDIHIRRAICDALSPLLVQSPEIALELIEKHLLQDRDRFVHERTWNALRTLMNQGVERAEELCARLIEIA